MFKAGLSDDAAQRFLPVTTESSDVVDQCTIKDEAKPTLYAWFVLFVMFAIRAIH
jgi:hypothetical protein